MGCWLRKFSLLFFVIALILKRSSLLALFASFCRVLLLNCFEFVVFWFVWLLFTLEFRVQNTFLRSLCKRSTSPPPPTTFPSITPSFFFFVKYIFKVNKYRASMRHLILIVFKKKKNAKISKNESKRDLPFALCAICCGLSLRFWNSLCRIVCCWGMLLLLLFGADVDVVFVVVIEPVRFVAFWLCLVELFLSMSMNLYELSSCWMERPVSCK